MLVTLLATNKTLVVLVPTVPLSFHPGGLGTLASVVFVSIIALQLGFRSSYRSSNTPGCRLPACSMVGLNYSLLPSLLVYDVKHCVGVMHNEVEPHLPFHLTAKLEQLRSRFYRLYLHPAMLRRVLPTTEFHHVRQRAVSKVFSQGTLLHEHPAVYRHARIHLQHTENLPAKLYITRLSLIHI